MADQTKGPGGTLWGPQRHECSDGHQFTSPAASFQANAFGLHDMLGNVWDWIQDVWHDNYRGAPRDGSAWIAEGDHSRRVLRGGWWSSTPRDLRSANRIGNAPVDRISNTGFRIARTL